MDRDCGNCNRRIFFALAQFTARAENRRAFQASSPNPWGSVLRTGPFFCCSLRIDSRQRSLISLSGPAEDIMADTENQAGRLQVANARPDDSGRGLARLSRATMNLLGLVEGDVVEIVGKRSTPARAMLPYPEDEGLNILRLDGLQRANAGVGS